MVKIDTSGWKPFCVGELFEKLDLKFLPDREFNKGLDISEVKSDEFNLPLVNAKHSNNGIMYYGRESEWEFASMTIDIVADGAASTGDVYAQPQKTGVLYNAYLVKPKANGMTKAILFFLATVMQRCVKDHFGYDNKCTWDKVKAEAVFLPVDTSGKPDWAYMESYMSKVMRESEACLRNLRLALGIWRVNNGKHAVDVSDWRKFVIGDLFEKLQLDIKKEEFNKTFDVSEECTDEFNLPLVNAKHGNNGIMYYGREADFETAEMTIDIVQNGAIATGDVYAQPQKTGVLWDAYLVKPKAEIRSAFALMFLAAVLEKAIKDKFSYDDKCVWDKAKLLTVTLPCTSDNNPDWEYMDKYMQSIVSSTQADLSALQEIW